MNTLAPHLTLGAPQVSGALAVFPVLGPEPRLRYRSLAAALGLGAAVKEVDGAGAVGSLVVQNPTDLPLLCFEGEEVRGARQDRTFDVPVLIGAGRSATVPVSCVEQGRWEGGRAGEGFTASPAAPDPGLRARKRASVLAATAAGAPARADQGEVWSQVGARLARHGAPSATAALRDVYAGRGDELARLSGAVRAVPGQLGALAQVGGAPVALDLVSRPEVFADLLGALAAGYALDALDAPDADPDPAGANGFLAAALAAERRTAPTPGMGDGIELRSGTLVGGGLCGEEELVALSAFPADGPGGADATVPRRRIARPSRRRRS